MKITDQAQTWEDHLEMINLMGLDENPPTLDDGVTPEDYGDLDHVWYPGEDTEDYELGYNNAVRELEECFSKLQFSQNNAGILQMVAKSLEENGNPSMGKFIQKISNYLYVNGY